MFHHRLSLIRPVPLCVEGWDEALQKIGRLSHETIISPQNATSLLKAVEEMSVLVIAGAEDAHISLKSSQAMASKLVNSRLVAISWCGHLPHEECPKALLAAISPFISRLLLKPELLKYRSTSGSTWGISSIFGGSDNRSSVKESSTNKPYSEPAQNMEHPSSMIHLREPPAVLRPSECSETEAIEIAITKLLLRSYYDIVRKNIEDSVPKAIIHFLVNHSKRELHNVFIKKLYRENLFEEMLQEPDEIASKRKRTRETLRVLQQAFRTLDELPLEAETVERGYSLGSDPTGLPKIHGLPTSSMYSTSSGSNDSYAASPKNPKSRKSSHSGELQSHLYANADSNGSGRSYMPGLYPTLDL